MTILFFVGLLLFAADAAAASTAMRRLLWPLSDQQWPKSVELRLVRGDLSPVTAAPDQPLRNVQGQPLDLFVVNARGALPQPVLVEFRQRGRLPQSEPLRTATLRDSSDQSREAAAIRLPIEDGVVEFRAVGGDDREMPWHELRIVPPPKLESFRVEIVPPSYTGEAATTLPEGTIQVRATVGSRVKISAKTNRPVTRADADAASIHIDVAHEIAIAPNGRNFVWRFEVRHPGSVTQQLVLTDRDEFQNLSALRLDVVGIADPPPVVSLDEPTTDRLVTANGTVRLTATARDDRRLRDVRLEYSVGQVSNLPGEDWQVEILSHEDGVREAVVRLAWPLNKLDPQVGDRIALRVAASDRCDVGEPRVGRSATRTLTIVSPDEKLSEISHRLDLLLHDLESLATKQSQTKDQTESLRVQAEKGAEFRPQDCDSLKRVELDQRQIGSRLTGRGDGVIARGSRVAVATRRQPIERLGDARTLDPHCDSDRRLEPSNAADVGELVGTSREGQRRDSTARQLGDIVPRVCRATGGRAVDVDRFDPRFNAVARSGATCRENLANSRTRKRRSIEIRRNWHRRRWVKRRRSCRINCKPTSRNLPIDSRVRRNESSNFDSDWPVRSTRTQAFGRPAKKLSANSINVRSRRRHARRRARSRRTISDKRVARSSNLPKSCKLSPTSWLKHRRRIPMRPFAS